MTNARQRLEELSSEIQGKRARTFSPLSFFRWAAMIDHCDNLTGKHVYGFFSAAWLIMGAVSVLMGALTLAVHDTFIMPLIGAFFLSHMVFSFLDYRRTNQFVLEDVRWLTEDSGVVHALCSEEGSEFDDLKVALIELEDFCNESREADLGTVLRHLENAFSKAFPEPESNKTPYDLVMSFGSANAIREADHASSLFKEVYSHKGLHEEAATDANHESEGVEESQLSDSVSVKSAIDRWHDIQDQMDLRCDQFYKGVTEDVPSGLTRWFRIYQLRAFFSDSSCTGSLLVTRLSLAFVSLVVAMIPAILVAIFFMLLSEPNLASVFFALMVVWGTHNIFKRLKKSIIRHSKILDKSNDGKDLILLDLFYRSMLSTIPSQEEVLAVDTMLSHGDTYLSAGHVKELWMAASLKDHHNFEKSKKRRFDKRCSNLNHCTVQAKV